MMSSRFNVRIGDQYYPLYRDAKAVHPATVHQHLGTRTEAELQRLLDALYLDAWFNDDGSYVGRDPFGIGLTDQP
jgi:hypothetical protein